MSTTNQHLETRDPSVHLQDQIAYVRKRLFSVGVIAALGWVLLTIVIVLMLAVWFDLLWELPAEARLASFAVAGVIGLVLFATLCGLLLRKSKQHRLAGRLDQAGQTGGEITTGLELSSELKRREALPSTQFSEQPKKQIESGLAVLAVERAAHTASSIAPSLSVPTKPIKTVALALAGVGLLLAVAGISMPKLAQTQWARFTNPTNDVPPFSTIEFAVTPGDTQIKYGEGVDVVAKLNSTPIDELELVIQGENEEEIIPMFSEGDNQWRATLFRVTEDLKYEVRSGRARSEKYDISLILVPEIADVQFRISPPEYTRLGSTIVSANDGIRGLPGTRVEIMASSNRPLSAGKMTLTHKNEETAIELSPRDNATEVTGEFQIQQSGKFEIRLTDVDGVESTQSVSGSVSLLEDTKPFVRLVSPKQNSWSTATINLPISIAAEDDYGLSNISLYRSLNDSRPVPIDFEFDPGSIRINARAFLPLFDYDLQPGDKLEMFARVEDNDPASIKGSESPIHVVHIISRQQYERMNREQLGIEAVLSKYRMIQRRLEGLELMQKEIEAMDAGAEPKSKPADPKKEKMLEVAQEFQKSAEEMKQMLQRRSPIDFDQDLEDRIEEMSEKMAEISSKIRELVDKINDNEIDNEKLKEQLEKLREELEGIRDAFNKEVMAPLQQLTKIFPLMKAQQEFVQLVLRQRNLADRLRSLKGSENADRPDIKRRMRELADEQRTLLDRLDDLLFNIENEAYSLPAEEEFNELRDTALKFAADVAESAAMPEQQLAEKGLAEFSGSLGFKHASEAAAILESFVDNSDQMSQQGEAAAKGIFKPGFNRPKFGNSMDQLMKLFGPKNGSRQAGQNNRGLYGDQPRESQAEKRGSGQDNKRSGSGMYGSGASRRADAGGEVKRAGGNTGSGPAVVPLRYERKVGDYYRRIVEELGE